MSEALKLCPFCGKQGRTRQRSGDYWEAVCLNDECCALLRGDTKAEAIAAWNTRHDLAEALAEKDSEVQSLKQQRAQLELLARNQEWTLAPDDLTAEQHAAAGGAFFDREGNVHRIGEQEPEGECWLWVLPNAFKQAVDAEVARES